MKRLAAAAGIEAVTVVNSCAVTNEAVRQTRQTIRRERRAHPERRIIVTGCAAQTDPGAFAGMVEVDHVLGNGDKLRPEAWESLAKADAPRLVVNDVMAVRDVAPQLIEGYGDRARAFLQIQNGCDHRCTFCTIPFGRGPSRSVGPDDVINAARRLVDAGHAEIVLTGVDVTSWGADLPGAPRLGRLIARLLDETPDLVWLRLSSIDGAEVDPELFERAAGDPRFAPHLHLSLQSGDDIILKRMKRRHTRDDAIALCAGLRARRSDIAFGADLIAGFPTETDAMFENSLRLIDDAGLSYAHVFPFSARRGTPAARMPQLDGRVVAARAARLRAAARAANEVFLDRLVGADYDVVLESGGQARLGNFALAVLDRPTARPPGSPARISVTGRRADRLEGTLREA